MSNTENMIIDPPREPPEDPPDNEDPDGYSKKEATRVRLASISFMVNMFVEICYAIGVDF